MKRIAAGIAALAVLGILGGLLSGAALAAGGTVAVVEVTGEVNAAVSAYIAQAVRDAERAGTPVVLDIDTYGGQVVEADNIKKTLLSANIPVHAYIRGNALSAGVLICVACERIVMAPPAVVGAAETIPDDEKTLASWVGILRSAAEARGRDAELVAAMADKRVVIEGVSQADALLTLGAADALILGFSDGTAATLAEALDLLGYGDYRIEPRPMGFPVRAAQFLTSTAVLSLLLLAAIVCMGIEIITPGFGVFGVVSLVCFGLYFGGGFLAGYAQWWSVALFLLGVVFMGIEIAVPGFGVFGILGILGIGGGLLFATRDVGTFLTALALGAAGSIVALPLAYRLLKRLGLVRRVMLLSSMTAEEGYVSHEPGESLLGQPGVAVTDLRPAGFARIGGSRVEVVSSGAYIHKGTPVVVTLHTPGRVVVDEKPA